MADIDHFGRVLDADGGEEQQQGAQEATLRDGRQAADDVPRVVAVVRLVLLEGRAGTLIRGRCQDQAILDANGSEVWSPGPL